MTTKTDKENLLAGTFCSVHDAHTCQSLRDGKCLKHGKCIIGEKTEQQLDYIFSNCNKCIYLEACAGSGKTEVLGMKTAYEICHWSKKSSGVAVLTFTNEAANTIKERVQLFYPHNIPAIHYIGTFAGFVHGYIAQKFGYAFFQKDREAFDKSFSIIDKSTKSYDNNWLKNYELNFPTTYPIYANQLVYQSSDDEWNIDFGGDTTEKISDYYKSDLMQKKIQEIRINKGQNYLFKYKFLIEKIEECKHKFWNDGFATFEDINQIALCCLEDKGILKALAKKFPLILVDECQDLSFVELKILSSFMNAGSTVHFIGDLNQAIYSFKDAYPKYLTELTSKEKFQIMHLSDNFRSCQKIVDVACSLQSINSGISGTAQNLCGENSAVYFEYENESSVFKPFEDLLYYYKIPKQNAIVLTRSSNLKNILTAGTTIDYKKHPIISAIQLWKINSPDSKRKALLLLGWQLQRWLKSIGRKDNYFCPANFDDVFRWRLTLRDILDDYAASGVISTFDNKVYSEWYHSAKNDVIKITNCHLQPVLGNDVAITGSVMRVPSKTGTESIQLISKDEDKKIRIDTIHAVKGCSFDAVLLVSTPDGHGKTGYWENWIDEKDETTRFCYVASTRAKFLLAWAVPRLDDKQHAKIEAIGLKHFSGIS